MDSVKVKKGELREILGVNRAKHRAAWEEAFEGYRIACIKALEQNLAAFKAGAAERVFINESPPEDHTSDYDRVLKMLDMSVEDEVTLTAQSFEQYVLDDWEWKRVWAASNTKYLTSRPR